MATLRPWSRNSPGELFDHRRLPGAADRQIADGDHLHPERGIPQDANVVKKAAGLDGGLEELGTSVEQGAHERLARPTPLLDDHFQEEGLKVFCPRTKPLTQIGRASCRESLKPSP